MKSHTRKNYSLIFKIRAVERYLENNEDLKMTADEPGVHQATMKHWVNKGIEALLLQLNSDHSSDSRVKKLERELQRLREDNDILKKAARMFAAQEWSFLELRGICRIILSP